MSLPFNGDYYDNNGNIRNLMEIGPPSGPTDKDYTSPFNGDFFASDGSVHNIDELIGGAQRAKVFATVAELDAWLGVAANKTGLQTGDNFYIIDRNVPDYWWDGTQKQELETGKVDLTDYPKTEEVQTMIATALGNVLQKNNTVTYTPTANYHPATKKYVDDNKGLALPSNDDNVYAIRNGQYIKITGAIWYEGM